MSATTKEFLISPQIAALQQALARGDRAALDAFWQKVTSQGTPLIEPLEDESGYRLVTFLWRDPGETQNVVVIQGPAFWGNWFDNMLSHLPGSDLWYKTYHLHSDLPHRLLTLAERSSYPTTTDRAHTGTMVQIPT
jgi:enterochelin esterase family protein